MPVTLADLTQRFGIPGVVAFEPGDGGLTRIVVTTDDAEGWVYLHGAHVAHYRHRRGEYESVGVGEGPRPGEADGAGGPGVLFTSGKSWFEDGKPIRGGVPVCFPWFAVRADDPKAPSHGFVRLREWAVESVTRVADGVQLVLLTRGDDATRSHWPHDFELRHRVTIGKTLTMSLETTNTGRAAFTFEQALHSYYAVGDVREASVTGLENAEYLSKVQGNQRRRLDDQPLTFAGETDFVFLNTRAACIIDDPVLARRITIEKTGSDATVVWNPWITKAQAMPDFGDNEWPGMLCVETAAVNENAVTLAPGKTHVMTAKVSVEGR